MTAKKKANMINTIVVVMFLMLFAISVVCEKLLPGESSIKNTLIIVLNVLIYLIPATMLRRLSGMKRNAFFKLRTFKLRMLPTTVFAALTASLGGIFLNLILIQLTGAAGTEIAVNPIYSSISQNLLSAVLAVVIVPSIMEEIFFRGAYLSSFCCSLAVSIPVCALVFAMMHANIYNFFGPFFAGLVFGLLTVIFKSVYPAIIAHIINNTVSFLLIYYMPNIKTVGLDGFIIMASVLLFFLFLYFTLKAVEPFVRDVGRKKKMPLSQRVEYNEKFSSPINTPFFVLCALYILKIVYDFLIH